MARKKLPTELEIEDLLKSLDNDIKEDEIFDYQNDIIPFLSKYEIKPGTFKVTKRLVYYLYKLYSQNAIELTTFSRECLKYLDDTQGFYLINKKDIELSKEIYKLYKAKKRVVEKSPHIKTHFQAFLNHYKLVPGTYYIESFVLFNLYDQFNYNNKKINLLGYKSFIKMCNLFFQRKRLTSNRVTWYGVDKSITDVLTPERLTTMREGRVEFHGKKKKKENPKRIKKIPKS